MRQDDVARQHEFNQDIELYGLNCDFPRITSLEKTQADFETQTTKVDENSAWFAIEADGMYIGNCCLLGLNSRHGNLELGIVIGDRAYWGRGYGRDATRLLLDFGFHYLGKRRIVLTTHIKNQRATRCYRACGFVEEGRPRKAIWVEGEYVDLVNMSILREEWLAQTEDPHQ
jgi:RimJ/RimL family protein N-acetyltransferase